MTVPGRGEREVPHAVERLSRPRLLTVLDGRFERRLTIVTAGAGFGKTTLLRQALDRNREDQSGQDRWLSCRPVDDRPAEFASALRRAVGCRPGDSDPVEAVCDELWRQSPAEVALFIDDVHHLSPQGASAAMLQDLLDQLPDNAHLVVAGRRSPSLRSARLEASGESATLSEKDLAFTGEEQTAFLATRAPDREATDVGGWPALLELSVASASARVDDFVWEEVVDSLAPAHALGLARLLALDWIDEDRIVALLGPDTGLYDVILQLPLCHQDDDGRLRLHALWERVLGEIDLEWHSDEVAAAASALADRGWYREGLELCLNHGGAEHVDALVHRYVSIEAEHLPSEEVETFVDLLPDASRHSRFGRFLEGRLQARRRPIVAKPLLSEAQEGFAAHGEAALEVSVLALLGQVAFSEWDPAALRAVAERARVIATPEALSLASMMEATRSTVEGAPFDEVQSLLKAARVPGVVLGGSDGVVAGVACRLSGVPEQGAPIVARALAEATRASRPLLLANDYDLKWLLGQVDDAGLAMLDAGPTTGLAEMTHQASGVSGLMAFANAVAGRTRQARRHLERADAYRAQAVRGGLAMPTAARMALEIGDGREDIAASIAEDGIDASVMADPGIRRALPMALLVSEKLRAEFEGTDLGPCYEEGRRAVESLLALRHDDDPQPAAALSWTSPSRFRVYLVPSLMLELALAASVAGNRDALGPVTEMARLDREAVRRLATHGAPAIRDAAGRTLKEVPARPDDTLELRTLGPLELRRDGVSIDDEGLRRGKVRAMLQYLVARGGCRREELGVALWPDFDEESSANNLRVTLSHATKLLEPDRRKGEPAYRLRADAERVELHLDQALVLDVAAFDELLDAAEAADRRGRPARTLALLEDAIGVYTGDYLADSPEPAWGEAERTRLRHRFVAATLRAGELRLGHGDLELARDRAVRARDADAYCEAAARLEALVYLRRDDRATARSVLESMMATLDDAGVVAEAETTALLRRCGAGN